MDQESEKRTQWAGWDTTKILGRGSYGSVYQIEREIPGRADKERAALKVMSIPRSHEDILELTSQGYDKASITQYFRSQLDELIREYAVMLELKGHTNIVYCDELKWTPHEDGIGWNVYIKMELLKPLKSVLGNVYDEQTVLKLGADISRALVRCREKNIIHRDIKPQNIMVSSKGDYKLGDFGVAKVSEKTSSGTIAGTYEYMAPEVFRAEAYNSTADIYSLGIVMYWMMNHKRTPFLPLPPEIPSTSDAEMSRTRRFSGEQIPEPANGSSALKQIVLKACAYSPGDRYQRAEDLLRELESLLSDRPEPEPRKDSSAAEEENKPVKRRRRFRKLIPVIAAAGGAAAVLTWFALKPQTKDPTDESAVSASVSTVMTEVDSDRAAATELPETVTAPVEETVEPEPNLPDTRWEKNVFIGYEKGEVDRYPEPLFGTEITKSQIIAVTFLDSAATAPSNVVDVSEAKDGSVVAWFSPYKSGYEMIIAGEGGINGKNTYKLFINYENLEQVNFNGNFHTDYAESMYDMFVGCGKLTSVDFGTLDTSNVTSMENMFSSCLSLEELDLTGLETGNVTTFSGMFRWCENLRKIDVSTWDTSSVEEMCVMFQGCRFLTALDLSGFDTSSVTTMSNMFTDCQNLQVLDVSGFNTANVKDFSRTFYNCTALPDLDLSHFDVSAATTYESFMPANKTICGQSWKKLFEGGLLTPEQWEKNVLRNDAGGLWDNPVFGTEITKEQIVAVTFLDSQANAPTNCIDASEAGDRSVLAWVSGYDGTYELFFAGEGGICAPESCYWIFGYYTNCRQFNFNGNFHTENVKNMSNMFYGCTALTELDVSTFDTSNVEDFSYMFGSCSGLTDLDLRTMDTSSATNMYNVFGFCSNLKNVDMSTWDTSGVTTMGWMFYHCTSLEELDLRNFDTGAVTDFYRMFSGCSQLRRVDVSSFDTSAATDMQEMFAQCPLLEEMDLSHFDVSNVEKFNNFMNHNKKVNGKPWLNMFGQY